MFWRAGATAAVSLCWLGFFLRFFFLPFPKADVRTYLPYVPTGFHVPRFGGTSEERAGATGAQTLLSDAACGRTPSHPTPQRSLLMKGDAGMPGGAISSLRRGFGLSPGNQVGPSCSSAAGDYGTRGWWSDKMHVPPLRRT